MARRRGPAILGGFVGLIIGYIGGGIMGMQIFGNHFTSFTFAGARGYEAGLLLGGITGGAAGATMGVFLALKVASLFKNKPK